MKLIYSWIFETVYGILFSLTEDNDDDEAKLLWNILDSKSNRQTCIALKSATTGRHMDKHDLHWKDLHVAKDFFLFTVHETGDIQISDVTIQTLTYTRLSLNWLQSWFEYREVQFTLIWFLVSSRITIYKLSRKSGFSIAIYSITNKNLHSLWGRIW